MALRDFTLFDVIDRNARLHTGATAFVYGDRRDTHADYLAEVDRLAAGLVAAGVGPGDRVVILSFNNPEFVALYGAVARLGAILVPINWRLSDDEIVYVASDAAPTIVVADAAHQQKLAARRSDLGSVRHWYGIGGACAPFVPFEQLPAAPAAGRPDVSADAPFVMFHTAAVSGRPRGALLTQAGLMAGNMQLMGSWALGPGDVNLGVLPLFHLAGLIMLLATQHAGGSTVVMPRFDAGSAARAIRDEKVTLLAEFPPILGTLLDTPGAATDFSSLRIVTGLDTAETIGRFEGACPAARFWVAFGQSETSGFVTLAPFRDRPGSAGCPAPLSIVEVVDERDRPLPAGDTGEIVVRGPGVFTGYWKCDADTAFTFRNGWHHTGDMGAFDADGYLWYKGRSPAKELIKPGGENVYPAEVEGAIAAHPAIAEVVVIGVPDTEWGEAIKAVCVCRPGQSASAQDIIDFVGARIARFKRPKHVVFVDALPKSPAGTTDRNKVKEAHA
ncbi:MAG TPA: AMP-binding protein [Xanthobacteraceae bacterium]|nr:AMP-binding protein [Xanthobacteraceae bacterium]